MGGHLALLLLRKAASTRTSGLLLIAPAANMTELMWAEATDEGQRSIMEQGVWARPSAYGDPYLITRKLIEDGRRHIIPEAGVDVPCPVRILHGEEDADVPWQHGLKLYHALRGEDVQFTLVKGGDHRLSSPSNIRTMLEAAESLARMADGDR
jgi:pimeloyl-ACP methyl ester carboxylesterase